MGKISKIKNFFDEKDWNIKYKCCETRNHIGGRSFYNDGTYLIDKYEININGKKFELLAKVTGRPMYWIFSERKEVVVSFSQKQLLEYLHSNRDIFGNPIY